MLQSCLKLILFFHFQRLGVGVTGALESELSSLQCRGRAQQLTKPWPHHSPWVHPPSSADASHSKQWFQFFVLFSAPGARTRSRARSHRSQTFRDQQRHCTVYLTTPQRICHYRKAVIYYARALEPGELCAGISCAGPTGLVCCLQSAASTAGPCGRSLCKPFPMPNYV